MLARSAFLILIASLPAGTVARAEDRTTLAGYRDYKFGMSETELRKRVTVIETSADGKTKGTWLFTNLSTSVNGDDYRLGFMVDGGVLTGIELKHEETTDRIACDSDFKETVGMIQAKYGAPDGPPDRSEDVVSYMNNSKFTFQDGGLISVVAIIVGKQTEPSSCARYVIYRKGDGGSF
jgi:hypothetical protein